MSRWQDHWIISVPRLQRAEERDRDWLDFLGAIALGRALHREMKQLMLQHAFRFVKRVIFLISPQNVRSQRALQKLGAVRVGSRPDAAGQDSYLYEITSLPLSMEQ